MVARKLQLHSTGPVPIQLSRASPVSLITTVDGRHCLVGRMCAQPRSIRVVLSEISIAKLAARLPVDQIWYTIVLIMQETMPLTIQ